MSNLDIVGTQSKATDLTSTEDGYKNLLDSIDKELWLTSSGQQWERLSPFNESNSKLWAPEVRRLREDSGTTHKLKQIASGSVNQFWRNYLANNQTTTPAPIAIQAGVTGFVVWNTVPRLINSAGDPQFLVDWHLNDRIVDTDSDQTT